MGGTSPSALVPGIYDVLYAGSDAMKDTLMRKWMTKMGESRGAAAVNLF
jgi:hypothetical protein